MGTLISPPILVSNPLPSPLLLNTKYLFHWSPPPHLQCHPHGPNYAICGLGQPVVLRRGLPSQICWFQTSLCRVRPMCPGTGELIRTSPSAAPGSQGGDVGLSCYLRVCTPFPSGRPAVCSHVGARVIFSLCKSAIAPAASSSSLTSLAHRPNILKCLRSCSPYRSAVRQALLMLAPALRAPPSRSGIYLSPHCSQSQALWPSPRRPFHGDGMGPTTCIFKKLLRATPMNSH